MDSIDPLVSSLIITSSLLVCAFFSGAEMAYISANRLKIELDSKQGILSAKILSYLVKKPSEFIASMLMGNAIALIVFGLCFSKTLIIPFRAIFPAVQSSFLLLSFQIFISATVVLLIAEFVPRAIVKIQPNNKLQAIAIPLLLSYILLYLPMRILLLITGFISKVLLRQQEDKNPYVFGRIDIENYVKEATAGVKSNDNLDHEITIFQNALDFGKVKARDCMVPRNDIVALSFDTNMEQLRAKFVETNFSKLLIYRDDIDNIIGYVHSTDLFKKPESIKNVLMPVFIVPETIAANEVFELFVEQKRSIAVVVDEFGSVSGMLTVEDIVEEIFGEINDEHDTDDLIEEKIDENNYLLSGRCEISLLNDKYNFKLPEDNDYDTLAGLILNKLEDIPEPNTQLTFDSFLITIAKVEDARIDLVKLTINHEG